MSGRHIAWFVLLIACIGMLFGCSPKKPQENEFFNKWKTLADESRGYSPEAKQETVEIGETIIIGDEMARELREMEEKEKPLPDMRVTLKMRNTDVRIILRTLAKAAKQNILINDGVRGAMSVNIDNMPWSQVFSGILKSNGLAYDWEGEIIRVMTIADMERDLQIEALEEKRQAQRLELKRVEPLVTQVIKVNFADAADLRENVSQALTIGTGGEARGSVLVDKHSNSLIVQAIRDDLSKAAKLIQTLDTPRSQIQLKAHIVETTNDLARELGVQWGGIFRGPSWDDENRLWVTPGGVQGSTSSDPIEGDYSGNLGTGISGQGFGSNFPIGAITGSGAGGGTATGIGTSGLNLGLLYGMIGDNILEVQLSALEEDNKLNILSSPSITTLDNQLAFTENGERIPYVTIDEDGDRNVEFEDAVLRLEITPHVIDRDLLKLHVVVKKDEVDFSRTVDGNPVIIKKQTETNLIVRNAETIVISGLSRSRNIDSDAGVPVLKDVPGLGYLFKSDRDSDTMEEVLVFITPHILAKRSEAETAQR